MGTGIKKSRRRSAVDIDEECDRLSKTVLSDSSVLALVLHEVCTEFMTLSLREVKKRIERHRMKRRRVDAEAPVALEKTESLEDGAKTNFDVLFEAESPQGDMIRINIEVQGKYPKSSVMKGRFIYYTARLISTQKAEAFFSGSNYDGLRKVYSIWICLNPPAKRRGYLVRHRFMTELFAPDGKYRVEPPDENMDKVNIIEICLAKDSGKQPKWMAALGVLFDTGSTPEKRAQALEENGIKLTRKEKEEFMEMFSYSKYIRSETRKEMRAEMKAELAAKDKEIAAIKAEKDRALLEKERELQDCLAFMKAQGFSLEQIRAAQQR